MLDFLACAMFVFRIKRKKKITNENNRTDPLATMSATGRSMGQETNS